MFARIVVPLDGSDAAAIALPIAREMARRFDARLHLVQVVDTGAAALALGANAAAGALTDPSAITGQVDARVEVARSYLSAVAEQLVDAGFSAEYDVPAGSAGDGIIAAAADTGADLIVMSSHGHTGLSRLLMGSVTDHVVRNTTTPVLVVRATDATGR